MITVSAPGKLFLLGEHAVVYDGKCLVTAVDSRLRMTLSRQNSATLTITAPDVGLDKWSAPLTTVVSKTDFSGPSAFIESCVALFYRQYPFAEGLQIETASDFGATLGLGSSSATVAAAVFGLASLLNVDLSRRQLFDMGVEAIQQVQHLGSGADLAAAIYGGTLYYSNQSPRDITPLDINDLPLLVVYSGAKAGTVSYVKQVRQLRDERPTIIQPIIATMLTIVDAGREALENHDWEHLGQLMNIQHGLLHGVGVDTLSLAEIVFAARDAGAMGAKLSGAGGGDCAIILCQPDQCISVRAALELAGKRVLDFKPNAAGVHLEA